MRNWGLGFLICCALAIVGLIAEPQEDYKEGLFGTAVFLVGGGYLFNKGQKYLNTMKEVAAESLNQIREKEYIDTLELSKKFLPIDPETAIKNHMEKFGDIEFNTNSENIESCLPLGYKPSELTPEMDILDTWATSSLSPFINSGGLGEDPILHKKIYPMDLRP